MSNAKFMAACDAAVIGIYPSEADLAKGIEDGIKRYARLLRKHKPSVGQRSMLEQVAKACRVPDWHFLQSRLKEAINVSQGKSGQEALIAIRHTFPFYHCHTRRTWSLAPEGQEAMLVIGRRLVNSLHLPLSSIMDALAHLMSSQSWQEFSQRTPMSNPSPMYTCIEGPWNGRSFSTQLERTDAAFELEDVVDEDWSALDFDNLGPAERESIRHRTERVLSFRPDFLIGWSVLLKMYEDDGEKDRYKWAVDQAISNAEKLLPEKINGKLSFDYEGSSLYLRFLGCRIEIQADQGDFSAALKTFRRLRSVDHTDAEASMHYALLLALEGKSPRIPAEIAKLQAGFNQLDGRALVLSACYLLRGEVEQALTWFLVGAVIFPYLLPWLRGEDTDYRSAACDLNNMAMRMTWLRQARPKEFLFMLRCANDGQIEKIVHRFNDQYERVVNRTLGNMVHMTPDESDHWVAALPDRVARLVPRVLRSMGVHSST